MTKAHASKPLTEMTLEELWELFPIELVEHRSEWAEQYERMEARLANILRACGAVRISHVGSTAIDGIWAKPIVDVLVELANGQGLEEAARLLEQDGFIRMSEADGRISLNAGYTEDGFADEVFHVHLRREGDNDELYFRDYLVDHPDVARAYEALKLDLWRRFEHDRDGYTNAKSAFVLDATAKAKTLYPNVY